MSSLKCSDKMIVVKTEVKVTVNKDEANLIWKLIYNARSEQLEKYGETEFSQRLGNLMEKFIYPDNTIE